MSQRRFRKVWRPTSEQEILAAIEAGNLIETTTFDAKAALPLKGKSKDLAKDVAAMANDGGTLLYGVISEAELASYPTGWYSKCLNLNSWPTKIMACSTPNPSSRSLSYSAMKAPELMSPRNISRASSSVGGADLSSTLIVLGLYQCI
jgi:hypothetical protein